MKLYLDQKQKFILITALQVYQDELLQVSEQTQSRFLKEGYRQDAEAVGDLLTEAQNIKEDYRFLDENIRKILSRPGNNFEPGFESGFIPAIKFLRGETGWSLKESKEYVEKIRDAI